MSQAEHEYERAIEVYTRVMSLDPKNSDAPLQKAMCLTRTGARTALRRAAHLTGGGSVRLDLRARGRAAYQPLRVYKVYTPTLYRGL